MGIFRLKRKRFANSFLNSIQKSIRELGRHRFFAGRLVVPPDMKWWAWQEFGTATSGETPYASGKTYPIYPVKAKALRWPSATAPNQSDGSRVQSHVEAHPGVPPRHFVLKSLHDIRFIAGANLHGAFLKYGRTGVQSVRTEFIRTTMRFAIARIEQEMSRTIPGTRVDGKLLGETAAAYWSKHVTIIDTSDTTDIPEAAIATSITY